MIIVTAAPVDWCQKSFERTLPTYPVLRLPITLSWEELRQGAIFESKRLYSSEAPKMKQMGHGAGAYELFFPAFLALIGCMSAKSG